MAEYRTKHNKDELERSQAYTPEKLAVFDPDYIVLESIYYDRYFNKAKVAEGYPHIKEFFESLLGEEWDYDIVFDKENKPVPRWAYPQSIDYVTNRTTILKANR